MSDIPSSATIRLTGRVAVWSRDERARQRLVLAIQQNGYEAVEFATIETLRTGIASAPFSACVIDEPDHPDMVRATELCVTLARLWSGEGRGAAAGSHMDERTSPADPESPPGLGWLIGTNSDP